MVISMFSQKVLLLSPIRGTDLGARCSPVNQLNRSTHVVADRKTGNLRLLTPVEAERLQGFDDNWTNTGMPDRMRYFCMGNALVVPMITRMGKVLNTIIAAEK